MGSPGRPKALTDRDLKLIDEMVKEKPVKCIAALLGVSEHTVHNAVNRREAYADHPA